ncbi:MAG TPA: Uma2 family endonuclease [Gemmataceae bacterium]|nr:Uma2 family endonuclease [Gemmataceae bacterium]
MVEIAFEDTPILVPDWVRDLESFRRWSDTDHFPQERPVWWLKGKVWIDMSREQIFTHNLPKTRITIVVGYLVQTLNLGLFLSDGLLLSNFAAGISGNPDATFVSNETLRSDRVRLIEGSRGGYAEIQGAPDMVLEVVSRSSVEKDYDWLRKAYWEADIREYWLVDAREEPVKFEVFRHAPRGYAATRKSDGWVKSAVFGKSFKLTRGANDLGHPEFTLAVR